MWEGRESYILQLVNARARMGESERTCMTFWREAPVSGGESSRDESMEQQAL